MLGRSMPAKIKCSGDLQAAKTRDDDVANRAFLHPVS